MGFGVPPLNDERLSGCKWQLKDLETCPCHIRDKTGQKYCLAFVITCVPRTDWLRGQKPQIPESRI